MKLLTSILFFLLLTGLTEGIVRGQSSQPVPPDCVVFISMSANGSGTTSTGSFDNRNWQCESWTIGYQAIGTGSITSLTVQSAPVAAGGVAGTYGTYAGTVVTGINPNTSSTGAVTQLDNGAVVTPFMRVLLTEGTFVGPVTGVLYGWRTRGNPNNGGGGGGGCADPCTVIQPVASALNGTVVGPGASGAAVSGNPVRVAGSDGTNTRNLITDTTGRPIVVGPAATGAAVAGNPVYVGGNDGTNVEPIAVDTAGRQKVVGAGADGAAVAGNPVLVAGFDGTNAQTLLTDTDGRPAPALASVAGVDGVSNTFPTPTTEAGVQLYSRIVPYVFNGSTNDRQFSCTLSAAITLSAGTDVVIVPLTSATTIRICGFSYSSDTSADVTIRQGTGTTCGTNQVALSGAYKNVLGLALDFGNEGALRTTVAARDVCLHFSASSTVGGIVTYAVY